MNKETDVNDTIAVRQQKDKEAILEQLRRMPIVQVACEKAGVGRATYYRFRNEDNEFKKATEKAMAEGAEFVCDMSEGMLVSLIKDKNFSAIHLWLRKHHPKYADKIDINARITSAPTELTPEQEMAIGRALKLASLVEGAENNNNESNDKPISIPGPEQQS